MHFKLIVAFVEDSKTDDIMDAAREAGATGCAVISNARGEGIKIEPASHAEPYPAPIAKMKKPVPMGPALFICGSGGVICPVPTAWARVRLA